MAKTSRFINKEPIMWSFDVFVVANFNKLMTKHSSFWWFETQWRSHMVAVMNLYIVHISCWCNTWCGHWETHRPWWRHQMETFSALLALCSGNSPVTGEFPSRRPVTRNLDVFFDLRLNKRLSKQSWGWCFETPSRSLWRHRNGWRVTTFTVALPDNSGKPW